MLLITCEQLIYNKLYNNTVYKYYSLLYKVYLMICERICEAITWKLDTMNVKTKF